MQREPTIVATPHPCYLGSVDCLKADSREWQVAGCSRPWRTAVCEATAKRVGAPSSPFPGRSISCAYQSGPDPAPSVFLSNDHHRYVVIKKFIRDGGKKADYDAVNDRDKLDLRSEERRVGKECGKPGRSRGWPDQ